MPAAPTICLFSLFFSFDHPLLQYQFKIKQFTKRLAHNSPLGSTACLSKNSKLKILNSDAFAVRLDKETCAE